MENNISSSNKNSVYEVTRVPHPIEINSDWEKAPWKDIEALHIDNHMGEEPDHKPGVRAKVAYDEEALYVIFHVKDQYVRCVADEYQGPVFRDSCVEFFFTPANNGSMDYFNLETNCGGTALFHFNKMPGRETTNIPKSAFNKMEMAHSLPSIVKPEIKEATTWTLEYRLPFEILTPYFDIAHPEPGVEWKANFYKCADDTSHPHWLTWSLVDLPDPNFHRPDYFGTLRFL